MLFSSKIKNKTFKQFKKSGKIDDYKKFKRYRDLINKLKRKSMTLHYKNYFAKHLNNSKKTWTGINTILCRKSKAKIIQVGNYSLIKKRLVKCSTITS